MKMRTFETVETNIYYATRQDALRKICRELNLEMFLPNYHGKDNDGGTVIIYTKDAGNGIVRVCDFESTDRNGFVDFQFLNHGKIDLRNFSTIEQKLRDYITTRLENIKKEGEQYEAL